ncbi:nicotinic acetylcholine receptor alpha6 [Calliopsis andreniformis]|uniref:nicotinic acetylcholine receptor alpha6 n=1 Tax=Calliopsis andreniformis TaxID=337506 RepID=UPI003FCC9F30
MSTWTSRRNSFTMASQTRGPPRMRIKLYMVSAGLQIVLLLTVLPQESLCGPDERRLLNELLSSYNTLERPVANDNETLEVKFGVTLQQIIDVDEKNQILTTNAWLKLEWTDYNLQWNESEYGGVKDLRITPNRLWKPDILMYNSAEEGFDGTYQTNVVVSNNGHCLYVPPGIFKSTCKIDITWFPFDDQHCQMKFGSWSYNGFQVNLEMNSETGSDLSDFIMNGEWYLIGMPGQRNSVTYQCCPEPYIDITFIVQIRRRTLYYFFNLIVPCVLISSMALLGFTLPPDSGEKLTLGVTILLSLTVFLNLVAESMPTTSDAVPLIGVTILLSLTVFLNLVAETLPQVSDAIPLLGSYFNCIMFMVASSVVLTVLVLNFHHRSPDRYVMPEWIKMVFLQWLPWMLCMNRPGKKIKKKNLLSSNRMKDIELKERSSKSLLANVLDIDDDFRHRNNAANTPGSGFGTPISTGRPTTVEDTSAALPLNGMQEELHTILKELRFITDRMKKADESDETISDWKFAAMVVDRLCLYVFTLFTIFATIVILLRAPHIIVH